MAEKIIQNPSITSGAFASMLAFSSDNNTITAISGHPIAGVGGGGTPVEGYWRPSVNTDGDISWAWSLESTSTVPSTANIKGPQGIQGETGPQGPSGTNGTNGISPTFTITPTASGTHVVLSGAQGESSFDVLSGAKGADGQKGADGFSPTIELTPVTSDAHNNGGTQVDITYKNGETTATASYTAWNGNDGEGASVNLFGNNGVSVTKDGSDYTVGLSGGYYAPTLSAGYADYAASAYLGNDTYLGFDKFVTKPTSLLNKYLVLRTDAAGNVSGWCDFNDKSYSKSEADGRYQKKADMGSYLTTAQYETDSAKYVSTGDILTGTSNTLTGIKVGNTNYMVPTFTGVTTAGSISGDGLNSPLGLLTSAENALTAVANKSHVTIDSNQVVTTENNGTSATVSAAQYITNDSFGTAPKQLFVCQDDNDLTAHLNICNGKGTLFFVCSAI